METVLINQSRTSLLNVDGQTVAHAVTHTYSYAQVGNVESLNIINNLKHVVTSQ